MFLTASEINAYHDSAGQYPPSLKEIAAEEDGITYHDEDDSYTLFGVTAGVTIEYHSADDIDTLAPGQGNLSIGTTP